MVSEVSSLEFPFLKLKDEERDTGLIRNYHEVLRKVPHHFDRQEQWMAAAEILAKYRISVRQSAEIGKLFKSETKIADLQWRYLKTWLQCGTVTFEQKCLIGGWLLSLILKDIPWFLKTRPPQG